MIDVNEAERSPFVIEEPVWLEDAQHPNCMKCNRKFDFTHRRHHCRRCGKIFCGNCCSHKVSLPRLSFVDPERVCEECSHIAKRENDFFEKHLKTLCDGAVFAVDDTTPLTFCCRVDHKYHREIEFECKDHSAEHEPVCLVEIVSVQLLTDGEGQHVRGMMFKYKEGENIEEVKLYAITSPEEDKKHSLAWIAAMQRAVKMLFEVGI